MFLACWPLAARRRAADEGECLCTKHELSHRARFAGFCTLQLHYNYTTTYTTTVHYNLHYNLICLQFYKDLCFRQVMILLNNIYAIFYYRELTEIKNPYKTADK